MKRGAEQRLRRLGFLAILSLVAFVAIWVAYRAGSTQGLDHEVAARIRGTRSTWLDALSTLDDALFRPTPTFGAAIALAVVLLRCGPPWSWCAPPLIGLTTIVEVAVKAGASQLLHPRTLIDGLMVLFGGAYHAPAAFPSGHVTRAIFLAVTLAGFAPRRVWVPFAILALTTPYARMYGDAHHLSDVVAGAVLGTSIAAGGIWAVEVAPNFMRWLLRDRPAATD